MQGHSLKLKLVAVLNHGNPNTFRMYTITEEYQKGANHVIDCTHGLIQDRVNHETIPPTMCVQFENCTRKKDNRNLLSYLKDITF